MKIRKKEKLPLARTQKNKKKEKFGAKLDRNTILSLALSHSNPGEFPTPFSPASIAGTSPITETSAECGNHALFLTH